MARAVADRSTVQNAKEACSVMRSPPVSVRRITFGRQGARVSAGTQQFIIPPPTAGSDLKRRPRLLPAEVSGEGEEDQRMQIVWSLTAIVSVFVIVFILTRE